jgi:hypothetical protein
MRINLSSYIAPNPHNHKYVSHIVLDEKEIAKVNQAFEALKNLMEHSNYQANVYNPCNGLQASIVRGILSNLDEVEITEN